jgi:YesN/AraC family two-component response regulator
MKLNPEILPSIIISDVNIPKKDGFELREILLNDA